jgi:hypothetical protein
MRGVDDAAVGAGTTAIDEGDMVAGDAGLARLALHAIGRGEVAELELGGVAVGELALAGIDGRDGGGVGQQEVEREVAALLPLRAHDRAASVVLPIRRRHALVRVVISDGFADEAVDGLLASNTVCGVAGDVHRRGIAEAVRVVGIDVAALIDVVANASRLCPHGDDSRRCVRRGRVERESVGHEHGGGKCGRVLRFLLPPSGWG